MSDLTPKQVTAFRAAIEQAKNKFKTKYGVSVQKYWRK